MKRLSLAVASALLFAAPAAQAADMALKAPPPPAPVYSWTGFYIGGEVGGEGMRQSATTNPFPSPGFGAPPILGAGLRGFGNLPTSHSLNASGAFGGLYAGYNWQTAPNFLLGVEAHFDWLHRGVNNNQTVFETFSAPPPGPAFNMLVSASNNWIASARARAGWVTGSNGQGLLYVTGGAAWTRTNYSATDTGLVTPQTILNFSSVGSTISWSNTRTGYAIGVGGEWMLTQHWLLRAEYVHYGFAGSSATLPLVSAVPGATCAPGACNWALSAGNLNIDTGIVGLSYKF
jgi:outer membrane immunogenic protein